MDDLFVFAAQNTIVALVLAMFVYALTRVWRHPPARPRALAAGAAQARGSTGRAIDWSHRLPPPDRSQARISSMRRTRAAMQSRPKADHARRSADRFVDGASVAAEASQHGRSADLRTIWIVARPVLLGIWLGGAACCALMVAACASCVSSGCCETRCRPPSGCNDSQLTSPASSASDACRDVRCAECVEVPLAVVRRRPPDDRLAAAAAGPARRPKPGPDPGPRAGSSAQARSLGARHRAVRGDSSIGGIRWCGSIRRQIHQAEDLCCDAWVRRAFPDCTRRYAEVVLQAAESLSASQLGARLLPASPFLRSLP